MRKARAGWADAAKLAHARDDDRMLDPATAPRFDDKESYSIKSGLWIESD
jgi:hypothetical protein